MNRRNIFAIAAVAVAGVTGGWWAANKGAVVSPAAAVERSYGRGFFAGGMDGRFGGHAQMIEWVSSEIERELDLTDDQKRAFARLVTAVETLVAEAEPVFAQDRDALRAMPLGEQVSALRQMAQAADTVLSKIEVPVADFDATLDDSQRDRIRALMDEYRGGRRSHWRDRG